ncbi:hypothetical protein L9F63_003453, partial [Diploptera punctata]
SSIVMITCSNRREAVYTVESRDAANTNAIIEFALPTNLKANLTQCWTSYLNINVLEQININIEFVKQCQ